MQGATVEILSARFTLISTTVYSSDGKVFFSCPQTDGSIRIFCSLYTLGDDDLENIRQRRRPENRIGFALQLCALRYPGRALAPGEMIPREVLSFVGAQLGVPADALLTALLQIVGGDKLIIPFC